MGLTDLDAWLAEVGKSAYGEPPSLRFTYDKTRELLAAGIPGDLVECGTAAGVHPAAMARACIDAGETRTIRIFDSFQGVPNGSDRDTDWNEHYGDGSGALEATGIAACSQEDVIFNLSHWLPDRDLDFVELHEGWFQNTVAAYSDYARFVYPIAFLRLDCDLYESYLTCLTHLYPLVSPGGIVCLDDWNLDGCRAAVRDCFTIAGQHLTDISLHYMLDMKDITESGDVWFTKPHIWP